MAGLTSIGKTRPRRRIALTALVAAGLLGVAVLAAAILQVATTRSVTVVNDGLTTVRLSGCVDDSLDLPAGHSSTIDAPKSGQVGCDVFIDFEYAGCLKLASSDSSPVGIAATMDRQTSQTECEKIG